MEPPCLPQSSLSLFWTFSLYSSLSITSSPSLSLSKGADSSQRPSLSKRACYSAPSLWDSRKNTRMRTHMHACIHTHAKNLLSQRPCTQHTPMISASLSFSHARTQKIFFICPQNTCVYKNFGLFLEDVLPVVSISQNMLTFCMC